MSQMRAAAVTRDFSTDHAMAGIAMLIDNLTGEWTGEAGPATAGVVFVIGVKQFGLAAAAMVDAAVMAIPVLAGEGGFGAFLAGDAVFVWGEFTLPFEFGFLDDGHGGSRVNVRDMFVMP